MKKTSLVHSSARWALVLGLTVVSLSACSGWVVESSSSVSLGTDPTIYAEDPPPPLPQYEQPECPAPGYLWTPGYWGRSEGSYYWVPGSWIEPPQSEVLWTPGYWDQTDRGYVFHEGYWASHVGFYGGVNYGHGYSGVGYEGGRWDRGHFSYNRAITNVNVTIVHNTYNAIIIDSSENRSSYNGGISRLQPSQQDQIALMETHIKPTAVQADHQAAARGDTSLYASQNRRAPPIASTIRAGAFDSRNTVPTTALSSNNAGRHEESKSRNEPMMHSQAVQSRDEGNGRVGVQPDMTSTSQSPEPREQRVFPVSDRTAASGDGHPVPVPSPKMMDESKPTKPSEPEHKDKAHVRTPS